MVMVARIFLWGVFLALPSVNGMEYLQYLPLRASHSDLRMSIKTKQEEEAEQRKIPQGIERVEKVSRSRSLELLAKPFNAAKTVVSRGTRSDPVSPQKKLDETMEKNWGPLPKRESVFLGDEDWKIGRTLEVKQESPGLYSIKGRILEEFESSSGMLTLNSVEIDQKRDIPEWLKGKILAAQEAQRDGNWKRACELWASVYNCSREEEETFPESFTDKLRSLYITACLRLFEESPDGEDGEPSEHNLCYAFCTTDAVNIKSSLKFKPKSDGVVVKLTDDVLTTAGVYLYTLGRLWENPQTFAAREFGSIYQRAFDILKVPENRPKKNFISWVLQQAFQDKETQRKVADRKPKPFLY